MAFFLPAEALAKAGSIIGGAAAIKHKRWRIGYALAKAGSIIGGAAAIKHKRWRIGYALAKAGSILAVQPRLRQGFGG